MPEDHASEALSEAVAPVRIRDRAAIRAAAWMVGTLVSFTAMAIAVRELSTSLHTFEILAWRSAVGLVAMVGLGAFAGWQVLKPVQLRWQIGRNLMHFVGQAGWAYGIAVLPLATVFTLEFTMPAWASVLAILFLGERMTLARAVAVGGGFVGILVILQPGVVALDAAMLIVLGSALAYAMAHTMTKHLTRRESIPAILFWMALIQLPIGLGLALSPLGDGWTMPGMAEAPWILVVGLGALTAHLCLARAFSIADAIIVMPLDFVRLPLVVVIGASFYGEALRPEVAIGGAIIVATLLYALIRERG